MLYELETVYTKSNGGCLVAVSTISVVSFPVVKGSKKRRGSEGKGMMKRRLGFVNFRVFTSKLATCNLQHVTCISLTAKGEGGLKFCVNLFRC